MWWMMWNWNLVLALHEVGLMVIIWPAAKPTSRKKFLFKSTWEHNPKTVLVPNGKAMFRHIAVRLFRLQKREIEKQKHQAELSPNTYLLCCLILSVLYCAWKQSKTKSSRFTLVPWYIFVEKPPWCQWRFHLQQSLRHSQPLQKLSVSPLQIFIFLTNPTNIQLSI